MSDSLERTTDCPLPPDKGGTGQEDGGESLTDFTELLWKDGGLPTELQRGMENLRVNRELTDVVLSVQGQDFPCHRAILAAASQYFRQVGIYLYKKKNSLCQHSWFTELVLFAMFRAMFCNGLRESHEERVEMKEVDSGVMRVLLEYTYTSQAHLTQSNVQQILEAASQFQVTCHVLKANKKLESFTIVLMVCLFFLKESKDIHS